MPTATKFGIILAIAAFAALATVAVHQSTTFSTEESAFKVGDVHHPHYTNWKKTHNHTFSGAENLLRAKVFGENYNMIQTHNANKSNTWTMGLGPFAHLTSEEFKALYLGLNLPEDYVPPTAEEVKTVSSLEAANIDWTKKGAVTGIKNQGGCGSCWAFSSTGALEGLSRVSGHGLPSFSEQQLVDCSRSYGNNGCSGGWMDNAFHYVKDHGITTESAYPYRAVQQNCAKQGGSFKVRGWVDIPKGNAGSLRDHLAGRPIAVALDAGNFQHYNGGVFNSCGTTLNHGVLVVGYDGNFKVKNSWGTSWGEHGYIRIKYGNTCGIANAASYPTA
jgi:hypothetical protein